MASSVSAMMLPVPSSVFDLNTSTCVAGRREPERTMRRAVTQVTVFRAASYCPRLQPHVPRSPPAGGFLPPGRVPAPPPVHRRQKRRQRAEHGGACQGPLYSSPKPQNGIPGCPRAHALPPSGRQGIVRYTALTNRTRKCPALLAGAGHFSWAGKPPPSQPADFSSTSLAAGSAWQGGM